MSNALNTFETELLTKSIPQYTIRTKKNTSIGLGIPEIYGYNVITDQDKDILNQGTAAHIKNYFDKKQADHEAAMKTYSSTLETEVDIKKANSFYSINSRSFVIKFFLLLVFFLIVRDFVTYEKLV